MNKECNRCSVTKDCGEFNKMTKSLDGLRYYCRECDRELRNLYYVDNKDKILTKSRKYRQTNKDQVRDRERIYSKNRREGEYLFKFKGSIRSLIHTSFRRRGLNKTSKTEIIIGCTIGDLWVHLVESALKRYGYWADFESYHIDHIIPISTAKSENDVIKLNHYSNLQLLFPVDNLLKGSNILDYPTSSDVIPQK